MIWKEPGPGEREKQRQWLVDFGRYSGLGIAFTVTFLLFGFLGWLADGALGTGPVLLILGIFVGATLGFIRLYYSVFPPPRPGEEKEEDS